MKMLSEKINHIVVLMLENRSFDSLLGTLYPTDQHFDGLSGQEANPLQGQRNIPIWSSAATDIQSMSIPDPDPGELWNDINMQLFGLDGQPSDQIPSMNGFVNNYMRQTNQPAAKYQASAVMHYYTPTQVPVISQLAKQFAVCDQWFASAPCQTWPNRFFVHTGTANGYENNSPTHFPYRMNTIFNRMQAAKKTWGIYYHDFPQSLTLSKLWPHIDHFHRMENFKRDAAQGNLPAYSFIEPRYFPDAKLQLPNDQHPPHHVGLGEQLIAEVYNTLRSAPTWTKTLLIITHDEHGGCFDHAPPPLAVPPAKTSTIPFNFNRYGVRVPAVIISPYIKPGTILRVSPDGNLPHKGPPYPFDHTSIIATVRKCFNLGAPLTERDAIAPDLESVLTLNNPDNNLLPVTPLAYPYTANELQAVMNTAANAPLNDLQKALHAAAAHLPPLGLLATVDNVAEDIENHLTKLLSGIMPPVPDHRTPREALPFIQDKLQTFMAGKSTKHSATTA